MQKKKLSGLKFRLFWGNNMRLNQFTTRAEWLAWRGGKITGTKLKSLAVKPRTKGISIGDVVVNMAQLEIVAGLMTTYDYREGVEWHGDDQRGLYLEDEAFEATIKKTGLKDIKRLDNAGYVAEDLISAVSPDSVSDDLKIAVETKCLASKNHLLAILANNGNEDARNAILKEFGQQLAQYFWVIKTLEKLIIAFYDPRFIEESDKLITLEFSREDFLAEIENNAKIIEDTKSVVKNILINLKGEK